MDPVCRQFASIAFAGECAVEIVHHTKKPAYGQEELTVYDSRGSGGIINAVRSMRVLNPMSKSEAESLNLDESERRRCFRIDLGKANMTLAADADWYRFESVELLNGDSVGVPTSYDKPDSDPENLARIDKVFMTILDRLASEGRTVNPTSGATYAPHVFAQEREAKEAKTGKKALAAAMKRLFEAKLIHVERVESGNHTVQSIARRRQ